MSQTSQYQKSMNGILIVDKPSGLTSHDVVDQVRRRLGLTQVGHTGTLDPMATGVLAILVGEATKLSNYLMEGKKVYEAVVRLGLTTDTWDKEGKVLTETAAAEITPEFLQKINQTIAEMTGRLNLKVPNYSAVKAKGRKLYEMARKNEEMPDIIKEMHFQTVDVTAVGGTDIAVRMVTSKGAYVRSWAFELGQRLGTGATLQDLRRTASLPYEIQNSIPLEKLESPLNLVHPHFIPMADALTDWPLLMIDQGGERTLQHGQIPGPLAPMLIRLRHDEGVTGVRLVSETTGQLLSILVPHPKQFGFKIGRVFNI
ncbi:MAG: tRNA pseudouridine(55) synthase TruB [Bdellovibrionales bacterium]|nr:tRNA pseudouridine(55) synthase TruB [Bdellovibrionales bacterium]